MFGTRTRNKSSKESITQKNLNILRSLEMGATLFHVGNDVFKALLLIISVLILKSMTMLPMISLLFDYFDDGDHNGRHLKIIIMYKLIAMQFVV